MRKYVLGYIITPSPVGPMIVMGYQKRGMWEGYINGFGGKIEENEPYWRAMQRELKEETGLDISQSEAIHSAVGNIEFIHYEKPDFDTNVSVHFFNIPNLGIQTSTRRSIFPKDWTILDENEEMYPIAVAKGELPLEKMPPTDKMWLPQMLHNNIEKGERTHCQLRGILKYVNSQPTFIINSISYK